MAFSFLTKHTRDTSRILLLDIGSASVGAALVTIEAGKEPHILATVRENIPLQGVLSSARLLIAMGKTLERALKNLQKKQKGLGAPAHIFCTLSSPWSVLKSRQVSINEATPFEVTEKTIEGFIDKDIVRLEDELKGTLPPADIAIIEKKILQMKLNGYEVKDPYGKTTANAEVTAVIGVSSKRALDQVSRIVRGFVHAPVIPFGTFPVAAWSAIGDLAPDEENFLLIDITGETTEVSYVGSGLIKCSTSFSYGKNFFIREISATLRTPHEEAASLFGMFLRDELDASRRALVGAVVTRATEEWTTRSKKALSSLCAGSFTPHKVFFTADADVVGFFMGILHDLPTEAPFFGIPEVVNLDQFAVAKFVSFESEVVRDPFLVVEALLAHKVIFQ